MRHLTNRARRQRAGFTLLETVLALTISSIVLGAAAMFHLRGQALSTTTQRRVGVQANVERALGTIARELAGAGISTLSPDPTSSFGTDDLTFQTPSSVSVTGVVTLHTPVTIELQMDDHETDNGIDDDHDGLVDERRIVMTRNVGTANQKSVTLCHGVAEWLDGETANGADDNGNGVRDEHGFNIQRIGNLLTIRITIESPTETGSVTTWTNSTAVDLHN